MRCNYTLLHNARVIFKFTIKYRVKYWTVGRSNAYMLRKLAPSLPQRSERVGTYWERTLCTTDHQFWVMRSAGCGSSLNMGVKYIQWITCLCNFQNAKIQKVWINEMNLAFIFSRIHVFIYFSPLSVSPNIISKSDGELQKIHCINIQKCNYTNMQNAEAIKYLQDTEIPIEVGTSPACLLTQYSVKTNIISSTM